MHTTRVSVSVPPSAPAAAPALASALIAVLVAGPLGLSGCAVRETSQAIEPQRTQTSASAGAYRGAVLPVSVGKFDNRSGFMRGVFSDGVDRLGSQAKTSLVSHLQQTGRFAMLERTNLEELHQEAQFRGRQKPKIRGADYVITGDVTEFGRKETGDRQFFGVFGSGRQQTAYSKVTLNVVDANTSAVVYSTSGAGEYALGNREVLGFGTSAGYDSTLNGKVLDLAIREAVDRLVRARDAGEWGAPQGAAGR